MALSGTLKDFGIADILQLIGHQTKTGTLVLKSGNDEVDVLFVDAATLSLVIRLPTTETLYRLFRWKTGTYEFNQEDVDAGKSGFEPIRAESILLEGFRRMDEWPVVRKKIPWNDATFERMKGVDSPPDGDGGGGTPTENHRLVYRLAVEGRTAEKCADVSLLGEF